MADRHQRAKDGPIGQAVCTCGETSPRIGTEARRVEWHRSHRREVCCDVCGAGLSDTEPTRRLVRPWALAHPECAARVLHRDPGAELGGMAIPDENRR